jgi:hypothetical protein
MAKPGFRWAGAVERATSAISTSMASSFETHRFAMLLWMRYETLMVMSRALRGVSNHEASGEGDQGELNRSNPRILRRFKCEQEPRPLLPSAGCYRRSSLF